MELNQYLKLMVELDASDLFFSTDAPVSVKVHGKLQPVDKTPLPAGRTEKIAHQIMNEEQAAQFKAKPEMNLALAEESIGRFRVNIFRQRNEVSIVIRCIKTEIPESESLGLPPILKKLIMTQRGLILMVGATGTGKSTTLASLINYRNIETEGHIITIEDPIEFIYQHRKSIVNQREVGIDTDSYEDALQNTLRQAPDVILIGEIRSQETMEHAIKFAETGHLCLSTLHANNANQAMDRIINFFPENKRQQLLLDLSFNLKGIVSQRLIPTIDKKRIAAIEILLGTPLVCDQIKRGDIAELKETMEKSENLGMQTFDAALLKLYQDGHVSLEEALRNADSANNLRLKISLAEGKGAVSGKDKFSLEEKSTNESTSASDHMEINSNWSLDDKKDEKKGKK